MDDTNSVKGVGAGRRMAKIGTVQVNRISSAVHILTLERLRKENVRDYLFTINVAGVVEIVVEHEKDFIVPVYDRRAPLSHSYRMGLVNDCVHSLKRELTRKWKGEGARRTQRVCDKAQRPFSKVSV